MTNSKTTKKKITPAQRRKVRQSRPKHKRLLLHPISLFILLCIGVLLVGFTIKAAAGDSYIVTAKVAAPVPTGPAVITSPHDGDQLKAVPITVTGTCPIDGTGAYIKLYRNDIFSGAALCTVSNTFQLNTDLFSGSNVLKVKIFNRTDDEGPASTPITVYFDKPAPSSNNSSNSATEPFTIQSDYSYRGYQVGKDINWQVLVSGGVAPYALNIDWGDGNTTLISQKTAGSFAASHIYKKVSPPGGYIIKINGTDNGGNKSYLQLFVLVNNNKSPAFAGLNNGQGGGTTTSRWSLITNFYHRILDFLWPLYIIILLMTLSFYLGERQELALIGMSTKEARRRRALLR